MHLQSKPDQEQDMTWWGYPISWTDNGHVLVTIQGEEYQFTQFGMEAVVEGQTPPFSLSLHNKMYKHSQEVLAGLPGDISPSQDTEVEVLTNQYNGLLGYCKEQGYSLPRSHKKEKYEPYHYGGCGIGRRRAAKYVYERSLALKGKYKNLMEHCHSRHYSLPDSYKV